MRWTVPAIAVLAALVATAASAAETMILTVGKAEVVRLPRDAANIVIGNPELFDITVEDPRLLLVFGRAEGQSNLVILDQNGGEILASKIVVRLDPEGHVHVLVPATGESGVTETVYQCIEGRCSQLMVMSVTPPGGGGVPPMPPGLPTGLIPGAGPPPDSGRVVSTSTSTSGGEGGGLTMPDPSDLFRKYK